MAVREGLWNCPACEGVNRGRNIRCQGCGQARGPEVKFYLPENEPPILPDNPLFAQATSGPDWICGYCDASNKGTDEKCAGCGAAVTDGKHRKVEEVKKPEAPKPQDPAPAAPPPPPQPAKGGCGPGCLALLVLFFLFMWWGSRTTEGAMEIVASRWERTIHLDDLKTYREDAWRDQVPSGARQVSTAQEVRSHRDVLDHYENVTRTRQVQSGSRKVVCGQIDKGNGFFEDKYCDEPIYRDETYTEREPVYRKEPVYDTKVYYDIERWKPTAPAVLSGSDHKPVWPSPPLSDKLKETKREAKYTLHVRSADGKEWKEHVVDETQFMKCPPGSKPMGMVSNFGGLELKP